MRKIHHRKQRNKFHAYQSRDRLLRKMGFKSYEAYLASPLWANIRTRAFERDGGRCRICKRPATQVHHTRYGSSDLTGYTIKKVVSLCAGCHWRLEFDGETKGSLSEANRKYSHAFFLKMRYAQEMAYRQQHDSDGISDGFGFWPGLRKT